jgi:hypothetical protein
MLFRHTVRRAFLVGTFASFAVFASLSPMHLRAQDDDTSKPEQHGRKYKAPPDTSHIEVTVVKGFNKKPIDGAHVVFNPSKDGVEEGSLEVKTHPDGKAVIDVIPTGSKVQIQVIADGFATYAEDYVINEASRTITIAMIRPRAQISTYVDNSGKASQLQPGVQVPIRPKPAATTPPASGSPSSASSSAPATSTPPDSSSNSANKPPQ